MRLASDSKLAFYPTNERETLRLLSVFGRVYLSSYNNARIKEIIGYEKYQDIWRKYNLIGSKGSQDHALFDAALSANISPEVINKEFSFDYQFDNDGKFVIMDGFCGEGEWLSVFKNFMKLKEPKNVILVGNEIEKGRYAKARKVVDLCYHSAFEEFEFPKQSVSLLLFNPPYGNDGEIRNAKRYLDMTIERDYLITPTESNYSYGSKNKSYIVTVLNAEDTLLCLPTIIKHFEINSIYKVEDKEEYDKFHQFIVIATKRTKPYPDNYIDAIEIAYSTWSKHITEERSFPFDMYGMMQKNYHYFLTSDINTLLGNFEFNKNKEKYISQPNSFALAWAKGMTKTDIENFSKITMPKEPKSSEIAILISAGTINGEVTDVTGKHIACGGVKYEMKQIEEKEKDEISGETFTITKHIRTSTPYLNILYSDERGNIVLKDLA